MCRWKSNSFYHSKWRTDIFAPQVVTQYNYSKHWLRRPGQSCSCELNKCKNIPEYSCFQVLNHNNISLKITFNIFNVVVKFIYKWFNSNSFRNKYVFNNCVLIWNQRIILLWLTFFTKNDFKANFKDCSGRVQNINIIVVN